MATKERESAEKDFAAKKFESKNVAPAANKITRNDWFPEKASGGELLKTANPSGVEETGYYGIPMLKRPLWKWEIALYFFFEGISAGTYMIATMADLFAKDRYPELTRAARYISLAALLPCPPLLIADLGRPERFHHMLRVWKPKSPMNLGAWALSGFSLPTGLLAAKQLTGDVAQTPDLFKKAGALVLSRPTGAAGIPFALAMLSYPGVLLSTTSTPVWSRTRVLGALFASSSMSTGAAALSLATALSGNENKEIVERLEQIENFTNLAEAAALTAYIVTSKDSAEPLTKGRYSKLFWLGAVGTGLVAPAFIRIASSKKAKKSRAKTVIGSLLSLAGGLALKWTITHAGRASAEDVKAAFKASRPNKDNPGLSLKGSGDSLEAV